MLATIVLFLVVPVAGDGAAVADAMRPVESDATSGHPLVVDLNTTGYPEGVQDEVAYQAYLDARAADLARSARTSEDPRVSIPLHLAAANWMLARQMEPAVSRWFLGISDARDTDRILGTVRTAREHLVRAESLLNADRQTTQPTTGPSDPAVSTAPSDSLARAQDDSRDLDVFANAIESAFVGDDPDGKREAAFELSVLLEDTRAEVAAAATLWQAVLFHQLDRIDRALERLPAPLTPPPEGAHRFGFFCRLYRCRCLAAKGGYAAASALLLQIQEQSESWFATPAFREDANRTASLLRIQVLEHWLETLDDSAAIQEREWCVVAIQRIRATSFGEPTTNPAAEDLHARHSVIRLGAAIPIFVQPPDDVSAVPSTTRPISTRSATSRP